MTDFAKPVTAAEVCNRIACDLRSAAARLHREAQFSTARAEELEEAAREVERDADMYAKWQPKEPTDG